MRVLDFIVSKQRIYRDPECDFNDIASGTRGYLRRDSGSLPIGMGVSG